MDDVRKSIRDEIDPNSLWLWKQPGWNLEKLKIHPIGRYFINVRMSAEAFVITDEFGDLKFLKVWNYHNQ